MYKLKEKDNDASGNALQDTNKQRWRNPLRYWEKQDKNMLVLSKLTSPREFVWKEFLIGIMRVMLQRKE